MFSRCACRLLSLWALASIALTALTAASDCSDYSAKERGLVTPDISVQAVLAESERAWCNASARAAAGATLAYVTPWNSRGYDASKTYRCKFDVVSPVWYQLRGGGGAALELAGRHDADLGWAKAVREPCAQGGRSSRVMPRVIFELSGQATVEALQARAGDVVGMLVKEAGRQGFDGWVLEAWSGWAAMGVTAQLREPALALVAGLARALRAKGMALALAVSPIVPAPGRGPQFSARDAAELLPLVDWLSVMTYDYSAPDQPGPNAPLAWVAANADAFGEVAARLGGGAAAKVLLGLNLYGNVYRFAGKKLAGHGEAVLGPSLLGALRQAEAAAAGAKPRKKGNKAKAAEGEAGEGAEEAKAAGGGAAVSVRWLEERREHVFRWKERPPGGGARLQHLCYYPTPASVAERVELAAARGMGLSLWEIGQGLDVFFDLL